MLYCEYCMQLTDKPKCPSCGNKKLRTIQDDDPIFLVSQDFVFAGTIEDILSQNKIPFLKRGSLGAGLTAEMGFAMETYHFFVPWSLYQKAQECVGNFLTQMSADSENDDGEEIEMS